MADYWGQLGYEVSLPSCHVVTMVSDNPPAGAGGPRGLGSYGSRRRGRCGAAWGARGGGWAAVGHGAPPAAACGFGGGPGGRRRLEAGAASCPRAAAGGGGAATPGGGRVGGEVCRRWCGWWRRLLVMLGKCFGGMWNELVGWWGSGVVTCS